jgi:hypothetical protein
MTRESLLKIRLSFGGDRPYYQKGSQEIKTNEQGEFNIPAQKPNRINITVVAKGWMPQLRNIDLSKPTSPQKFELTKGKKPHLKFVDSKEMPVHKVCVGLKKWRRP